MMDKIVTITKSLRFKKNCPAITIAKIAKNLMNQTMNGLNGLVGNKKTDSVKGYLAVTQGLPS